MNGWQPIATAPRDGTAVLLFGGNWIGEASGLYTDGLERVPLVCAWGDESWRMCDTDYYEVRIDSPTHWQPLPAPPEAS